MSFQINTNLDALKAYNALANVNSQTSKAQLRLASQKRINSVSDDTSGYRVGKELEGKVALMKAAQGNIGSAKNIMATAESALSNINDLLTQIRGKVLDASDPTKNLGALASDINALGDEIKSIFENTKFNDTTLLSGAGLYQAALHSKLEKLKKLPVNFGTLNTIDLSSITSAGSGATSANVTSVSVCFNSIRCSRCTW